MKLVIILLGVFLLGVLSHEKDPQFTQPTDSCSMCTVMIDGLEIFLARRGLKTKDIIKKGLLEIERIVCPVLPHDAVPDKITRQQCVDYVKLYGPYVSEMFLKNTDPSKICTGLGLCAGNVASSAIDFTVLMPNITEHTVQFEVETKIENGDQLMYKMFLANPGFLHEDMMAIQLTKKDVSACSVAMEVSNKTTYMYTVICSPNITNCKCLDYVIRPGRGVWYYVTITPISRDSKKDCSITLKATVSNIPMTQQWSHHFTLLPILLPVLCCTLCLCCCCMAVRRRCRKAGGCKWKCQKVCKISDKAVAVDMQPIPNQAGDATAIPMGYYYVPNAFGGQYIPVSQDAQPFAYPQFIPVQQE